MFKMILDESVPIRLADSFPKNFKVETVQSMGWNGTKNGKPLRLADENGFIALITADKNIAFNKIRINYPVQLWYSELVEHDCKS